jgi:hypothetical protein
MAEAQAVGKEDFLSKLSKGDFKTVSHMVYVAITYVTAEFTVSKFSLL